MTTEQQLAESGRQLERAKRYLRSVGALPPEQVDAKEAERREAAKLKLREATVQSFERLGLSRAGAEAAARGRDGAPIATTEAAKPAAGDKPKLMTEARVQAFMNIGMSREGAESMFRVREGRV